VLYSFIEWSKFTIFENEESVTNFDSAKLNDIWANCTKLPMIGIFSKILVKARDFDERILFFFDENLSRNPEHCLTCNELAVITTKIYND
jgi:hypothetical protein